MMKNTVKLLGILALAWVIGFSMTGCPTDGDGDNSGGGSSGGAFLGGGDGAAVTVTGQQVWTVKSRDSRGNPTYQQFTGDVAISGYSGFVTDAEIKGGKLSFSLGTPTGYSLNNIDDSIDSNYSLFFHLSDYTNVKANPAGAQYSTLDLYVDYSSGYNGLNKETEGSTDEEVVYVYVDQDVTISGTGTTDSMFGYTFTTSNFSLALKKGWNAVYTKTTWSQSKGTETITLGNPSSCKWVLVDENYYDYDVKFDRTLKTQAKIPLAE